ncbi:hypothetical protein ACQP1G_26980 [Nocardia sp. CA-107356]
MFDPIESTVRFGRGIARMTAGALLGTATLAAAPPATTSTGPPPFSAKQV